jgi:hypothetical protein
MLKHGESMFHPDGYDACVSQGKKRYEIGVKLRLTSSLDMTVESGSITVDIIVGFSLIDGGANCFRVM